MKCLKIAIKFCGNCNPHIDGPEIVTQLKTQMLEAIWLPADSPNSNTLLVVSSCEIDCATRPTNVPSLVLIAGETLDYIPCPKSRLVNEVKTKLEVIRSDLARNL